MWKIGFFQLPSVHTITNEIVFLGIASSAPDGFPLAVGMGGTETNTMKTVFIKPLEEWGLLKDIKDPESDDPSDTRRKNKVIEGIMASDLIAKGVKPEKAVELILDNIEGKNVYSVNPKQENYLLGKLGVGLSKKIQVQSAITLFDSFVSPECERELQLNTKMDLRYYPRNKSDIRWLIELYYRCLKQGSI
jgi:hypothetical protein